MREGCAPRSRRAGGSATVARWSLGLGLVLLCREAAAAARVKGRHAHWVVRTTNLERSLKFYQSVFGMRVLRHEEHSEACPITCNGESKTAWSKTLVGHDTEDSSYALELTFNYGVTSYPKGEALKDIGVRLRQPLPDAVMAAGEMGYGPAQSNGTSVHLTGPDGYRFTLLPLIPNDDELDSGTSELPTPFDHIRLQVQNVVASVEFYTKVLGMKEYTEAAFLRGLPSEAYMNRVRVVGYEKPSASASAVPLFLEEQPEGKPVLVTDWEGRHTVTMPEEQLRQVYSRISALPRKAVVHELRTVKDKLGDLVMAVVKDPDGLEVALLSSEAFDSAALAATDYREPDWEQRKTLASTRNVPVGSEEDAGATNKPEWTFEQEMQKHPKVFKEVEERSKKALEENIQKQKLIQEMVAEAQEVIKIGDEEAVRAIDFDKIMEMQKEVDSWVNRHKPDPKVKEAIEQAKMQAGGGMDQRKLKDIASNMAEAKDEDDDDDDVSTASHEEL